MSMSEVNIITKPTINNDTNIPDDVIKIIDEIFSKISDEGILTLRSKKSELLSLEITENLINKALDEYDVILTREYGRKYDKRDDDVKDLELRLRAFFEFNLFELKDLRDLQIKLIKDDKTFDLVKNGFHTIKINLDNGTIFKTSVLTTIFEKFATTFKNIFTSLLELMQLFFRLGSPLFDLIKNYIIYLLTMIGSKAVVVGKTCLNGINKLMIMLDINRSFETWDEVLEYLRNVLGERMVVLLEKINKIKEGLFDFLNETWPRIKQRINEALTEISDDVFKLIMFILENMTGFISNYVNTLFPNL